MASGNAILTVKLPVMAENSKKNMKETRMT
jgi:hypothetical protein